MRTHTAVRLKFIVVFSMILLIAVITATNSRTRFSAPAQAESVFRASDAAGIYARSCARCHGADGRAQTAKGKQTGATDFTSAKWQPNEARGLRTISGGKGKMPAFKGTLSADQIRAVWNYVRSFK